MATWVLYTTPKGEPIQKSLSFATKTKLMERARLEGWDVVKEGPYKYTYRLKHPRSMTPKGYKSRWTSEPNPEKVKTNMARYKATKRKMQATKVKKITKTKQALKKAGRR